MKKIKTIIALIGGGATSLMAGGDMLPIIPFQETELVQVEEAIVIECPISEPTIHERLIEVVTEEKEFVYKFIFEKEPAKKDMYVGVGGTFIKYSPNCDCDKALDEDNTLGGILKLGVHVTDNIDIEARATKSFGYLDGGGIEQHVGVFFKPSFNVSDRLSSYGLVGVANTRTENGDGIQYTKTNAVALGAGFEYELTKQFNVFIDYENYIIKKDSPTAEALSVGVNFNF